MENALSIMINQSVSVRLDGRGPIAAKRSFKMSALSHASLVKMGIVSQIQGQEVGLFASVTPDGQESCVRHVRLSTIANLLTLVKTAVNASPIMVATPAAALAILRGKIVTPPPLLTIAPPIHVKTVAGAYLTAPVTFAIALAISRERIVRALADLRSQIPECQKKWTL